MSSSHQQVILSSSRRVPMEDFYDEYRQELFEELMVQYELEQERQAELRRAEEEGQLEEEEEVY